MTRFVRPVSAAGVIEPRAVEAAPVSPGHRRLARLVGAAGLVALTAALFWLLSDPSFRVSEQDVHIEGLHLADEGAVRDHLAGLERSPNVFRVRPSEIVSELRALPEVESAVATVTLPGDVSVRLRERAPIFVWSDGSRAWLVDRSGLLFALDASSADTGGIPGDTIAAGDAGAAPTSEGDAAIPSCPGGGAASRTPGTSVGVDADLPRVEDERLHAEPPDTGDCLSVTDLAVMRQLLSLTPDELGVPEETLRLRVDPFEGYVLASDSGWQAVFGHYTPTLQPPDVIPRQVQCLTWLLASVGRRLETTYLSVSAQGCGTFTEFGKAGGDPDA